MIVGIQYWHTTNVMSCTTGTYPRGVSVTYHRMRSDHMSSQEHLYYLDFDDFIRHRVIHSFTTVNGVVTYEGSAEGKERLEIGWIP